jgi:putative transposase
MLDGVHLGEHLLVVALGVTDDGTKVPLGVVEGSTENAHVCGRLVADLADRGLDTSKGVLFVVDGGKALKKAIRAAFGPKALIQPCRRHKERNVLGHLPEAERPLIQRKLRAAWANPDADAARRELEALARALDKKRPGAAASRREGLADTLTVNRLGVTGSLLKTVESTNPVESMIEIVRHHAGHRRALGDGNIAGRSHPPDPPDRCRTHDVLLDQLSACRVVDTGGLSAARPGPVRGDQHHASGETAARLETSALV